MSCPCCWKRFHGAHWCDCFSYYLPGYLPLVSIILAIHTDVSQCKAICKSKQSTAQGWRTYYVENTAQNRTKQTAQTKHVKKQMKRKERHRKHTHKLFDSSPPPYKRALVLCTNASPPLLSPPLPSPSPSPLPLSCVCVCVCVCVRTCSARARVFVSFASARMLLCECVLVLCMHALTLPLPRTCSSHARVPALFFAVCVRARLSRARQLPPALYVREYSFMCAH